MTCRIVTRKKQEAARWWAGTLMACCLVVGSGCPGPGATTRATKTKTPGGRSSAGSLTTRPVEDALDFDTMPGRIHIVQRGDTLWNLAELYYGHGKHLHKIHVANRNRLKDPRELPVGMKLIIP